MRPQRIPPHACPEIAPEPIPRGWVLRLADTLSPACAQALRRVDLDGVAVKDFVNEAGIPCGTCADHGYVDCACGVGSR